MRRAGLFDHRLGGTRVAIDVVFAQRLLESAHVAVTEAELRELELQELELMPYPRGRAHGEDGQIAMSEDGGQQRAPRQVELEHGGVEGQRGADAHEVEASTGLQRRELRIAPSGLAFYTGDKLPKWKGDVFVGGLRYGEIIGTGQIQRILFNEKMEELRREALLTDWRHRMRDIRQGPDGFLYVLVDDDDGAVLRIEPAG